MGQVEFKLTGAKAIIAIIVVVAFVGFRYVSAASSIETDAASELQLWLRAEYTRGLLAEYPEPNEEMAQRALALDNINFVEINGRGTPDDMVVRVRIRVDGGPPPYGNEVRYFRMEYSQLTKWRLMRETMKWSYYLNLF
jgi:uncharacterized protein (UPF0333 family)